MCSARRSADELFAASQHSAPDTILRWHRELVAQKCTAGNSGLAARSCIARFASSFSGWLLRTRGGCRCVNWICVKWRPFPREKPCSCPSFRLPCNGSCSLSCFCSDRWIPKSLRSSCSAMRWRSCVVTSVDRRIGPPIDGSWRRPATCCRVSIGRCFSSRRPHSCVGTPGLWPSTGPTRPGRPAIAKERRALILRLALENSR
jgi:hypothetical protein